MIISVIIGATVTVTTGLKKKIGNHAKKSVSRFTTKDSYTWNLLTYLLTYSMEQSPS